LIYELAKLIHNLTKRGFLHEAMQINELLSELIDDGLENNIDDDMDPSTVVNIVGLRGDAIPEQPTGGFTVNPFFYRSI
jgi:hypothetical protein